MLEEAFSALVTHDLVLGPAKDGGYYLIGLRHGTLSWELLFEGIPWGSSHVLTTTVNVAKTLNLSIHFLNTLFDVDTLQDLQCWLTQEEPI